MSSHYLKMLASKSRERDPGAGWKHKGVSRRSTIAFPSEGGCSYPKAATVYPEKQRKWRKSLEKVMRKQLSWMEMEQLWPSVSNSLAQLCLKHGRWLAPGRGSGCSRLDWVQGLDRSGPGAVKFDLLPPFSCTLSSSCLHRLLLPHFLLPAALSATGN